MSEAVPVTPIPPGPQRSRALTITTVSAIVAGLLVYCLARYGDAVLGFFFLDDFWLLHAARFIDQGQQSALWAIFQPTAAGFGLYRPLTQTAYFYLLRRMFVLDATGYHAVQLFVFAVNTILVLAIARNVTASWTRAAAAAFLYAAAPGHAVAVYWIAAFTMVGTTFVILTTMLWWLSTTGSVRIIGCTVLQVIGLLCSEHAIVLPGLLGLLAVLAPRGDASRAIVRQLLPAFGIVMAYLAGKAIYFMRAGVPTGPYAPHVDPVTWVEEIGRYTGATVNVLTLAQPNSVALGIGVLIFTVAAVVLAARGHQRWCTVALGSGIFLVALLPVLPLTDHYYDYFIGIATLGSSMTIVALCDFLPRWGGAAAIGVAVVVLSVDLLTCDRAALNNPAVRAVTDGQQAASDLVHSMHATEQLVGPKVEIVVPRSPITDYVIDNGNAHQVFFTPPILISVIGGKTRSSLLATSDIQPTPLYQAPPNEPPFWWRPSLDHMREWLSLPARSYWTACEWLGTGTDRS